MNRTDDPKAASAGKAVAEPRQPLVGIVVLNWNKAEETLACIEALKQQTHRNLLIFVIDNGSTPASVAALQRGLAGVDLICNEKNLGFSGGVNVGIRRALAAAADYVWLVNNDAVAAPETLATLVAAMESDPLIGLASPVIRNLDSAGQVNFGGGVFDTAPLMFHTAGNLEQGRKWQEAQPHNGWVFGTALLIRSTIIDRIGLFDESFFAYCEDNDYCIRASAAGFRSVVVEKAEVLHHSGDSSGATPVRPSYYYYYMARNPIVLLQKHEKSWLRLRGLAWELTTQARNAIAWRSYPDVVQAIASGIVDGLRGVSGPYVTKGRGSAALDRVILTGIRLVFRPAQRRR